MVLTVVVMITIFSVLRIPPRNRPIDQSPINTYIVTWRLCYFNLDLETSEISEVMLHMVLTVVVMITIFSVLRIPPRNRPIDQSPINTYIVTWRL